MQLKEAEHHILPACLTMGGALIRSWYLVYIIAQGCYRELGFENWVASIYPREPW
jgi:hypothetical protein